MGFLKPFVILPIFDVCYINFGQFERAFNDSNWTVIIHLTAWPSLCGYVFDQIRFTSGDLTFKYKNYVFHNYFDIDLTFQIM